MRLSCAWSLFLVALIAGRSDLGFNMLGNMRNGILSKRPTTPSLASQAYSDTTINAQQERSLNAYAGPKSYGNYPSHFERPINRVGEQRGYICDLKFGTGMKSETCQDIPRQVELSTEWFPTRFPTSVCLIRLDATNSSLAVLF
jgi:hypothetical protein